MAKFIFSCFLLLHTITLIAQQDSSHNIKWPSAYEPNARKFYVYNEIAIQASPQKVWAYLVDAMQWPNWYNGAKQVTFEKSSDTLLQPNAVFKWTTMGLKFTSAIQQFKENRLLAWESKKKSIRGYHVWLIVPTQNGCKVITAEAQTGWLTFFEKIFQPRKLHRLHAVWLNNLKTKAETLNTIQ